MPETMTARERGQETVIDNETLVPYSDDYPDVMKDSFGHIWAIEVCEADTCHYYDDDSTLQGYAPTGTKGPASFIFQGTPEPMLICAMCHDGDWIEKDGVSYELHTETGGQRCMTVTKCTQTQ